MGEGRQPGHSPAHQHNRLIKAGSDKTRPARRRRLAVRQNTLESDTFEQTEVGFRQTQAERWALKHVPCREQELFCFCRKTLVSMDLTNQQLTVAFAAK